MQKGPAGRIVRYASREAAQRVADALNDPKRTIAAAAPVDAPRSSVAD
jgi:hypothetical protein